MTQTERRIYLTVTGLLIAATVLFGLVQPIRLAWRYMPEWVYSLAGLGLVCGFFLPVLAVFHLATAMVIRHRMRRRNAEGARKHSPYHVIYAALVWVLVVYSLHTYLPLFAGGG